MINNINYSKIYKKTKEQLKKFSLSKTQTLAVPIQKTVAEMMYGLLESGSACISDISRALHEKTTLKKTIERITRNLKVSKWHETIENNHLSDLSDILNDDDIIVYDKSDLRKSRAKHMEKICKIYDGSKKETGKGYYLDTVCIVDKNREHVIPALTRLYSTEEKGFKSQHDEREKVFNKLGEYFGKKGLYVFDRGESDKQNMRDLCSFGRKFTCRIRNINIKVKGKERRVYNWAEKIKKPHTILLEYIKNGKREYKQTYFQISKVTIEEDPYIAVAMQIRGHGICVLLTNQKFEIWDEYEIGGKIILQYGCRWSIEEKIRFEKQMFNIENIRVRSLIALRKGLFTELCHSSEN